MKITLTLDIDQTTSDRYFRVRNAEDEVTAIYEMLHMHVCRLEEENRPDNIQLYFEEEPVKPHPFPHLKRIK